MYVIEPSYVVNFQVVESVVSSKYAASSSATGKRSLLLGCSEYLKHQAKHTYNSTDN